MRHKKIVIKVGTKVITDKLGYLDLSIIKHISEQIVSIRKQGYEVILITSGAVASGRAQLKNYHKNETTVEKQTYAAVGQVALMNTYIKYFKKYGIELAQILVTKEDFRDKVHYQNMEACFLNVLKSNIIPVVNENDTVAVKELLFTDNDELAGLIALQLKVDKAIILSNVEGLMKDSLGNTNAEVINKIKKEDLKIVEKYITIDKTKEGRGGMMSKFDIAKKLIFAGIPVYIANGKRKNIISDIIDGKKIGTHFVPQ